MSEQLTVPPRKPFSTFMNFPLHTDLATLQADVAILGIPYGDPYTIDEVTNDQTNAPTAVRVASARIAQALDRYDFDFGGPLFDGRTVRVVDCGDVPGNPSDLRAHYRLAEKAARIIFDRGALLVTIGGDHGVPIPVFRALEGRGPVTLVHVDAHLDWRHEVNGVREGYSSPIRRASEMPWINGIYQIGIRGTGSARSEEVKDALAYGAQIITSYEVHEKGMGSVLARIPDGGTFYLSIDADGVDPTVMPAVAGPAPGGLLYHHLRELIHGLVRKGRVIGMDIVEITPARDLNEITSIVAGRFIRNLIGVAVRANYFG
jgi:agmatinase